MAELKEAGINRQFAQSVGIAVDHRRTNKCQESIAANVERLKNYKERLVVFPRHQKKPKKGDATAAQIAEATQLTGSVGAPIKAPSAVTFAAVTEEMKSARAYGTLRAARSEARLVGIRKKQAEAKKEGKETKKEAAPAAGDD